MIFTKKSNRRKDFSSIKMKKQSRSIIMVRTAKGHQEFSSYKLKRINMTQSFENNNIQRKKYRARK